MKHSPIGIVVDVERLKSLSPEARFSFYGKVTTIPLCGERVISSYEELSLDDPQGQTVYWTPVPGDYEDSSVV